MSSKYKEATFTNKKQTFNLPDFTKDTAKLNIIHTPVIIQKGYMKLPIVVLFPSYHTVAIINNIPKI